MLLWTAVVFNAAYVLWTVFDYVLVPEQWTLLFGLRVVAVAINIMVTVVVLRPRYRKYSFEGFWVLVVVWCAFIAPMLPLAGDNLSEIHDGSFGDHDRCRSGPGVAPSVADHRCCLFAMVVNAGFFFPSWTGVPAMRDVVANSFVDRNRFWARGDVGGIQVRSCKTGFSKSGAVGDRGPS